MTMPCPICGESTCTKAHLESVLIMLLCVLVLVAVTAIHAWGAEHQITSALAGTPCAPPGLCTWNDTSRDFAWATGEAYCNLRVTGSAPAGTLCIWQFRDARTLLWTNAGAWEFAAIDGGRQPLPSMIPHVGIGTVDEWGWHPQ